MLDYNVSARRIDAHGAEATSQEARIVLDTDLQGRADAFNPAELLLASVAACMLKSIERVTPMLQFRLEGVDISLTGQRQDTPPQMVAIQYEIVVETGETDQRLDLLHRNIRKFGTISNTVAAALDLQGTIRRKSGNSKTETP
ncbi:MAG: OsmC family protein [Hyphomonas sp.]